MKMNVYTIFDSAASTYMRPFFMQSDGQALRAFTDISTDAEHDVGRHPEDYSLARIGVYDDSKGKLIPEDVEILATALEVVSSSRNVQKGSLKEFDNVIGGSA